MNRRPIYAISLLTISAVVASLLATMCAGATFVVTNTDNSGNGSFRKAIQDANAAGGLDTIVFAIPASGVVTIQPSSVLPDITGPTIIDGFSQGGTKNTDPNISNAVLTVQLDGSLAGTNASGLRVTGSGTTISGLVINRFGQDGIWLENVQNCTVEGCYIGTNPTGMQRLPNLGMGIRQQFGGGNFIGGIRPESRNVISGNDGCGILILKSTIGDSIHSNLIGLGADGQTAVFNGAEGIFIQESPGNLIGGSLSGDRNVISGNIGDGILVAFGDCSNNLIKGNYIGTNANGDRGLTPLSSAVRATLSAEGLPSMSPGCTMLGSSISASPVKTFPVGSDSSNQADKQVVILSSRSPVTAASTTGNGGNGVFIFNASNCTVGGTGTDEGNVISGNGAKGVYIGSDSVAAANNKVLGNLIGTDVTGDVSRGNSESGVAITSDTGSATANYVGGSALGSRNIISGNGLFGVAIAGGQAVGNYVLGNYIGINAAGTSKLKNKGSGVAITSIIGGTSSASGNFVGGIADHEGNVISGNGESGILIYGGYPRAANNNNVQGNYIGTDPTGDLPLGNAYDGIRIAAADANQVSTGNVIGGTGSGSENVISANGGTGIFIWGKGARNNRVEGNYIGRRSSLAPTTMGNTLYGVGIQYGSDNTIGGAVAAKGNVVGGNGMDGVAVAGDRNTIQNNLIGIDFAGADIGNLGNGVLIEDASSNVIGCPVTLSDTRLGNTVSRNHKCGVAVTGPTSQGNAIRLNSIHHNIAIAIDLGQDGPTKNDPYDPDSGPNGLNNSPANISFTPVLPSTIKISGFVDSPNPSSLVVDLYTNLDKHPSNYGDGTTYIGSATPDSRGVFCFTLPDSVTASNVTATATGSDGSTSEFSTTYRPFILLALEATQVSQDLYNRVPLIAGKKTIVRAYLQKAYASSPASISNAKLRVFQSGMELTPALDPLNVGGRINTSDNPLPNRNDLESTLNFEVPKPWCKGDMEFRFYWDDGDITYQEPKDQSAPDGTCRDGAVQVSFQRMPVIRINMIDVKYPDPVGLGDITVSDAMQKAARDVFLATYPLSAIDFHRSLIEWPLENPKTYPNTGAVNLMIKKRFYMDSASENPTKPPADEILYGLIPGNDIDGLATSIPGACASGYFPLAWPNEGRATISHEIGHCLGEYHALHDFDKKWVDKSGKLHSDMAEGVRNEVAPLTAPLFPLENWYTVPGRPIPAENLRPTLGTQDPLNPADRYGLVFGMDTSMATLFVIDPKVYFEMMSYASEPANPRDLWPSAYTYGRLLTAINERFGTPSSSSPSPFAARDSFTPRKVVVVGGTVSISGPEAATIRPLTRVDATSPPPATPAGEYTLKLQDAGGNTLQNVPFDAPMPSCPESADVTPFVIALDDNPLVKRMSVWHNNAELAHISASANSPTVRVDYPNGGECLSQDRVLFHWTASDADHDSLVYDVQLSLDGGVSWETIASDVSRTYVEIGQAYLKSTTNGKIRVIASDGFNTASDVSDGAFSIPNHSPILNVTSPTVEELYSGNQQVVFQASAYDAEDGEMSDSSITWNASKDGVLGTGSSLSLNAESLSVGRQMIYATARDSAGAETCVHVWINVSRTPLLNYVGLSLSGSSSSQQVVTLDGLTYTLNVSNGGKDVATGVALTDTMPASVGFVSATSTKGTCSQTGNTVRAAIGSLAVGETVQVTIKVIPTVAGEISNTAQVTSVETDPRPFDNTCVQLTAVQSPAPSNPIPVNGEGLVSTTDPVQWTPGAGASTHDLYIWKSSATKPVSPSASGLLDPVFWPLLEYGSDYRWQVVANGDGGPVSGPEWAFSTRPITGIGQLADARLLSDGTHVALTNTVISAAFDGYFYAQSADRSSGIRVNWDHPVQVSRAVSISGDMRTNDQLERYVEACAVSVGSPVSINPLGMQVGTVGGRSWNYDPLTGAGQLGVTGGVGLLNVGLLVRVTGKVTYVDPVGRYFDVWDGSMRYQDIGGSSGIRVSTMGQVVTVPAVGNMVVATGVVSCYRTGSLLSPQILPINVSVLYP